MKKLIKEFKQRAKEQLHKVIKVKVIEDSITCTVKSKVAGDFEGAVVLCKEDRFSIYANDRKNYLGTVWRDERGLR